MHQMIYSILHDIAISCFQLSDPNRRVLFLIEGDLYERAAQIEFIQSGGRLYVGATASADRRCW